MRTTAAINRYSQLYSTNYTELSNLSVAVNHPAPTTSKKVNCIIYILSAVAVLKARFMNLECQRRSQSHTQSANIYDLLNDTYQTTNDRERPARLMMIC